MYAVKQGGAEVVEVVGDGLSQCRLRHLDPARSEVGHRGHRGLKHLYERTEASGVRADQLKRIRAVLAHLDVASKAADLNLPGYRLHLLKGDLKGFWSVAVSGNWRMVFRFEDSDARDVDLTDYH